MTGVESELNQINMLLTCSDLAALKEVRQTSYTEFPKIYSSI